MTKNLLILLSILIIHVAQASEKVTARDPFLNDLQYRSFLYFWDLAEVATGLIPDRAPTPSFSSIAAVGFALAAYPVAVSRKFVTRKKAAARTLTTLKFLWHAPQGASAQGCAGYHGFFYHFLDMESGVRHARVELSSIDTALLLAGALTCQIYFDRSNPTECQIRDYADKLYRRVDWRWLQVRTPLLVMGWTPEHGFLPYDWKGYNEAMILYILALGSPTFPIDPVAWSRWTETYRWQNYCGYRCLNFGPLFGHQYSHIWIDFRGIQDNYMRNKGIDYFENSRRAVYANRAYCIANPAKWQGYGENIWGLTACDGPGYQVVVSRDKRRTFHGYWARGASAVEANDDGTIAPTAVAGSLPFAPEICIPAIKTIYQTHGVRLFGKYGFYDAFNLSIVGSYQQQGWFDRDWLGIDNGPIVLMIENHYSNLIWKLMQKNSYLIRGLKLAGFRGGWLDRSKAGTTSASVTFSK